MEIRLNDFAAMLENTCYFTIFKHQILLEKRSKRFAPQNINFAIQPQGSAGMVFRK